METKKLDSTIDQAGMGIGISSLGLVRTVSLLGKQGTLSGAFMEGALAWDLQMGDRSGNIRRALEKFPFPWAVEYVLENYFVEGGISKNAVAKPAPMFKPNPSKLLICLVVLANYAYVCLAKEGHDRPVCINYLEKVAMPHPFAITGAIMGGIDYIKMGAGIPLHISPMIDDIVNHRVASYRVPVIGQNINSFTMSFDAEKFFGGKLPPLKRPGFLPIISSNLLANLFLTKLPKGSIYGFIVEEHTAGGHNALPRNKVEYSTKDFVNYPMLAETGLPFWIAGSYASPEKLKWALSQGATGVQLGSIFALCNESGMDPFLRNEARALGYDGKATIVTDFKISPTGFPFKMLKLPGTVSEKSVYERRNRVCNIGGLVDLYETKAGGIGCRCPSEPIDIYLAKGGDIKDTVGRGCVCNFLSVTNGKPRLPGEPPGVTLGDDLSFLPHLMANANSSYTAADVIRYLEGT